MAIKSHTFQVVCMGMDCKAYTKCGNDCILKGKFQRSLKGCTYSNKGDCNHCSHRKKCFLIKPYSNELDKVERKRRRLECENEKLFEIISEIREIELDVNNHGICLITDFIYLDDNINTEQKILSKISDNKKLIEAYLKKEEKLMKNM